MGRRTWRQRHKAGLFKRGQTPHNAGIKYHDTGVKTKTISTYMRLSKDMQELVDQPLTPNNAPQPGQVKLLRPLPPRPTLLGNAQVPDKENPEMDTYRLFHPGKTADLWNEGIKNHVKLYPECSGKLMWDESGEIQRGLAWREQLKCDKCSFVSKRHNLYTEVK